MSLFENDYDSFGVLFDVRTQGLDSVAGVVKGLISADQWAKDAQGSLIRVADTLKLMQEKGMGFKDAFSLLSQGGNQFFKFSEGAQSAARDVGRIFDEFVSLNKKVEEVKGSFSPDQNTPFAIAQRAQLKTLEDQMSGMFNRLAAQRERAKQFESAGINVPLGLSRAEQTSLIRQGGTIPGWTAAERVARELGATKPLIDATKLEQGASAFSKATKHADEFAETLSATKQTLRQVYEGLFEDYKNNQARLARGRRPWYGETDELGNSIGRMRTGAVLDMEGRPQPGSRARGRQGRTSEGDPVLTENMAVELENRGIAMKSVVDRMRKALAGTEEQAAGILNDWVTLVDKTARTDKSRFDAAIRAITRPGADEPELRVRLGSNEALAQRSYRSQILPEREMQRAIYETEQAMRAVNPNILPGYIFPGGFKRSDPTGDQARMRAEALEWIEQRRKNDTPAMAAQRATYDALIEKAKKENSVRSLPIGTSDARAFLDAPTFAGLIEQRRNRELERTRLGPQEYDRRRLENRLGLAEASMQREALAEKYQKIFGERSIDDLIAEIEQSGKPVRERRKDQNYLEQRYADFLREGKMPDLAEQREDNVRARQKQQRDENEQARRQRLQQESAARLQALDSRGTYGEDYKKALEEARRNLRGTFTPKGGSGADDLGPNPFTERNSAAYARMMDAERKLAGLSRERGRMFEDVETRALRSADAQVAAIDRVARARKAEGEAAYRAAQLESDQEIKLAEKRLKTDQDNSIAHARYTQQRIRAQEQLDALFKRRNELQAKTFRRQKDRDARDEEVQKIDVRTGRLYDLLGGEGAPGILEQRFGFGVGRREAQFDAYKQSLQNQVDAAKKASEDAAVARERVEQQSQTRLETLRRDFNIRQARIFEDFAGEQSEIERRVARARAKYAEDSFKELDRIFARRTETLAETGMRAVMGPNGPVETREFTAARTAQEQVIPAIAERVPQMTEAQESRSRSYDRLAEQINRINAGLERQRAKLKDLRDEEVERLAIFKMHSDQAPEEFQGKAQENLANAQIRAYERVSQAQNQLSAAEQAGTEKANRARQQYVENLAREKKQAEREAQSEGVDNMYQLMLQFAGATAAVKEFLTETIQYSARTETMRLVTEQMAKVNDISTSSILNQVSAVKALSISTQEAHGLVQRMMFAELDVAKATQLARVAQDAATISGENASEALNKIITGITTGQTRILHYMGLQVSLQQVQRQLREELGRQPTQIEERAALLNAVLNEGTKIQGNYTEAMLTAGHQVLLLKTQMQEAQNAIGMQFQPAYMGVITLMGRFANAARENSSEFATITRAVGGLTAAFLTLQALNFTGLAGGKFLAGLSERLALRPVQEAEGAVAGEAAGGLLAGAGSFLGRIPKGPWLALLTALGVGFTAYKMSGSNPMQGVLDSIKSTQSQQDIEMGRTKLAYQLGDMDAETYQAAMDNFFKQDRALRERAVLAVSQVWVDTARKGLETINANERDLGEGSTFGSRAATGLKRATVDTLSYMFGDNQFKDAGFSFWEMISGQRLGGAESKEESFQAMIQRMRERIKTQGSVFTTLSDGTGHEITTADQLKALDTWVKGIGEDRKNQKDPLYNVRLMLQQNAQTLEDQVSKEVESTKTKVESLNESLLEKILTDPVEKIRQKMEGELGKIDITKKPEFQAQLSYLQSIRGLSAPDYDAKYAQYASLMRMQTSLGVSQDQIAAYSKALAAGAEQGQGGMSTAEIISRAGLAPMRERLEAHRINQELIDNLIKENPTFGPKFQGDEALRENREQMAQVAAAYQRDIRREAMERAQKFETKQAEFEISRSQLFATPGVEGERENVEQSFTTRRDLEQRQHQERMNFIQEEYTADKLKQTEEEAARTRSNLLASEQYETNEKLRELDNQRILALEQINQQQRQIALGIDVERIQGSAKAQIALLETQQRGDSNKSNVAQQVRDVEVAAARKTFLKTNDEGQFTKDVDRADLELYTKQIEIARSAVDKGRATAEDEIRAQFDRSDKLLRAQAMGPLDQMAADKKIYENKRLQIMQIYELERQVAVDKKEKDDAEGRRDKALADADIEYLTQRMDLMRKQHEEGEKLAGDVFEAAIRQTHGQQGFRQMFGGMFHEQVGTVFKNIFGDAFASAEKKLTVPGQTDADGKPNRLGKWLQGTMFGIKEDPTKDIARLNERLILETQGGIKANTSVSEASRKLKESLDKLKESIDKLNAMKLPAEKPELYAPPAQLGRVFRNGSVGPDGRAPANYSAIDFGGGKVPLSPRAQTSPTVEGSTANGVVGPDQLAPSNFYRIGFDGGEMTELPQEGQLSVDIPQFAPGKTTPQLAFVNKNPANLVFHNQPGAVPGTPYKSGHFAQFPTAEAGYSAVQNQIDLDASRGLTLEQYIRKAAPKDDNDTETYIKHAVAALGVPQSTPLASIPRDSVAQFMIKQESGSTVRAASAAAGVQTPATSSTPTAAAAATTPTREMPAPYQFQQAPAPFSVMMPADNSVGMPVVPAAPTGVPSAPVAPQAGGPSDSESPTTVAPWAAPTAKSTVEGGIGSLGTVVSTRSAKNVAADVNAATGAGFSLTSDILGMTGNTEAAGQVSSAAKSLSTAEALTQKQPGNFASVATRSIGTFEKVAALFKARRTPVKGVVGTGTVNADTLAAQNGSEDSGEGEGGSDTGPAGPPVTGTVGTGTVTGSTLPGGSDATAGTGDESYDGRPPAIDSSISGGPDLATGDTPPAADDSGSGSGASDSGGSGSDSGASGGGFNLGTGVQVAGGAVLAYNAFRDFSRGGAQGILGGMQDLAGIASMIPGAQMIAAPIAMGLGIVKSLLGDPREQYKKLLDKKLKEEKFNDPDSIQETMNTSGQLVNFDFMGNVRPGGIQESGPLASLTDLEAQNLVNATQGGQYSVSPARGILSDYGIIQPPMPFTSTIAASQTSQSSSDSGRGNPVQLSINVQTMDAKSFNDNSARIADALRLQMINNHPLTNDIRQIAGA